RLAAVFWKETTPMELLEGSLTACAIAVRSCSDSWARQGCGGGTLGYWAARGDEIAVAPAMPRMTIDHRAWDVPPRGSIRRHISESLFMSLRMARVTSRVATSPVRPFAAWYCRSRQVHCPG